MRHWRLTCKNKWEAVNTWTVMLQSNTEPLSQPSVVPFLFEGTLEPDCPLYLCFTFLVSIGIIFIFLASPFFLLQFLAFQCCPPFQVLLAASQIPATTVSTFMRWFMFCLFLLQYASSGWLITEAEPFDFQASRLHAIIPFKYFLEVCGK